MAVQKTKTTKTTSTRNVRRSLSLEKLPRKWQTYLYYGLALIWGIATVKVYITMFGGSAPVPGHEPHPIVDQPHITPNFSATLLVSLLSLLPLAMCVLSIAGARIIQWRKVSLSIQVLVVLFWLVYSHTMTLWTSSFQSMTPVAGSLDDTIVRRLQCGDAVRTVDSYSFGAKTFYELKDRGYHLKATYDSPTGMLDSDAACDTYYRVRSEHPGNHIVLQIFTTDASGQPAPYLYKYAGQDSVRYGIFVKE